MSLLLHGQFFGTVHPNFEKMLITIEKYQYINRFWHSIGHNPPGVTNLSLRCLQCIIYEFSQWFFGGFDMVFIVEICNNFHKQWWILPHESFWMAFIYLHLSSKKDKHFPVDRTYRLWWSRLMKTIFFLLPQIYCPSNLHSYWILCFQSCLCIFFNFLLTSLL